MPLVELEQHIEKELVENMVLEEGREDLPEQNDLGEDSNEDVLQNDDFNLDDYISDDEIADYRLYSNNYSPDDKPRETIITQGETFQEYLQGQLGLLRLSDVDKPIAEYVVGNIDDSGYLRREPEQLVDDLLFHANIEVSDEHIHQIISLIQNTFEPAGIGAKDLQECLLLQLHRKQPTTIVKLAIEVLNKRFKDFTAHHYNKIIERLHITPEDMRAITAEITHLNPRPGISLANDIYDDTTITPDFIVDTQDGELTISLNNGHIPELRVNREYNEKLQAYQAQANHSKQEREAISFIKDRIDSARWFIDAIRTRNETLMRTMRAIVSLQREWFMEGSDDAYLKPMILKDIADRTGYDLSTISRVSNSKYVQTPDGIFPLKHFFSESMLDEDGNEIATTALKNRIQEIIDNEDKQNPINDEEMVNVLRKEGFLIARRTIAKYRMQLDIPIARLRREL